MELQDSYSKITERDIDSLCSELDVQLPIDYVEFLLRNNGGQPIENHFSKKDSDGEALFDLDINVFFGIGGNDTSYDILTMFSIYCDRVPEELLLSEMMELATFFVLVLKVSSMARSLFGGIVVR